MDFNNQDFGDSINRIKLSDLVTARHKAGGIRRIVFWLAFDLSLIVWNVFNGTFLEIFRGLGEFIAKGVSSTELSFWRLTWGSALLHIAFSFCFLHFLSVLGVKGKSSTTMKKLFSQPYGSLVPTIILFAIIEEIIFRWVPLYLLMKFIDLRAHMLLVAVISTAVFAISHAVNQKEGKRHHIFLVSQFIGGLLWCYVFLAYGLWASIISHTFFNLLIIKMARATAVAKYGSLDAYVASED